MDKKYKKGLFATISLIIATITYTVLEFIFS